MSNLPGAFIADLGTRIPEGETDRFLHALDQPPPTSVRLNPYKPFEMEGAPIPWEPLGRSLADRPLFTADPAFAAGAYYVQEASSMFVGWMVRHLGLTPAATLDLCAAPGGKSTQLSAWIGPEGLLVANEVIRPRAQILAQNIQKWGIGNTIVTQNDPADFARSLPGFFDLVVADLPCSGEGMFRKEPASRAEWSPDNVRLCAARGRRIVADVWPALRAGGVLVVSTCTYAPQENEEAVRWICEELGGELLTQIPIPDPGIVTTEGGFRFYPHRVAGEGFFIAAIRKTGPQRTTPAGRLPKPRRIPALLSRAESERIGRWLAPSAALERFAFGGESVYGFSEALWGVVPLFLERFRVLYSGVQMGEWIRGELKPVHSLALYHAVGRAAVPCARLDRETALEYLRKGMLSPDSLAEGLNLMLFGDLPIGWAKRIGRRVNNLYPSGWRILHY